ncbi:MAG TPA: hypothetical protein VD927_12395 [Chryseosolibacter sp.]|nr:hypothetical protein [Chryseosolibacter sp.]
MRNLLVVLLVLVIACSEDDDNPYVYTPDIPFTNVWIASEFDLTSINGDGVTDIKSTEITMSSVRPGDEYYHYSSEDFDIQSTSTSSTEFELTINGTAQRQGTELPDAAIHPEKWANTMNFEIRVPLNSNTFQVIGAPTARFYSEGKFDQTIALDNYPIVFDNGNCPGTDDRCILSHEWMIECESNMNANPEIDIHLFIKDVHGTEFGN